MLQMEDVGRANVRREHDVIMPQVKRLAVGHRDAGGVEDLEEYVQHSRMRLLDFVEQERPHSRFLVRHSQRAPFAKLCPQKQAERFLGLVLRHVEAKEFLSAEKKLGEGNGDFRLADTCWAEEQKTTAWSGGFAQPELAALEQRNDARDNVRLSTNPFLQVIFQPVQS